MRAAASSMASGMPSSRRTSSARVAATSGVSSNSCCASRTVDEQLDGVVCHHCRRFRTGRRGLQRRQHEGRLALDPERLATRHQHREVRTAVDQAADRAPRAAEHVLAVVDHHQPSIVADPVGHGVERIAPRLLVRSDRGADGARDPRRVGDRRQRDEPGASSSSSTRSPANSPTNRDLPLPPGPTIVTSRSAPGRPQRLLLGATPTKVDRHAGSSWRPPVVVTPPPIPRSPVAGES
jgi:hypothetical protein